MSIALYLGAPRCGKSTLLRHHMLASRVPGIHYLIVDRDGKETWPGPTFGTIEQFRQQPTIARFSVFRGPRAEDVAAVAIELGGAVYVDEEAHRAAAEGYGPARNGRPAHPLYRIAHEGAHIDNAQGETCEVLAMLATHRPANLPPDLIACADAVYLGRTVLYIDVERCYREGWVPAAQSSKDAQRILQNLQPGEFIPTIIRQ